MCRRIHFTVLRLLFFHCNNWSLQFHRASLLGWFAPYSSSVARIGVVMIPSTVSCALLHSLGQRIRQICGDALHSRPWFLTNWCLCSKTWELTLCSCVMSFVAGRRQVGKRGNYTPSPHVLSISSPQRNTPSPLLYFLNTHGCQATHLPTSL